MSAQPAERVTPIKQRKDLEVIITGKLDSFEIVGEKKDIYKNVIITPAADAYSHPSRFCVMSRARIGDPGGQVTVHAVVSCRPWKDNKGQWRYPHELWTE